MVTILYTLNSMAAELAVIWKLWNKFAESFLSSVLYLEFRCVHLCLRERVKKIWGDHYANTEF